MTNPARGEVALKLGEASYVLRPTFGAICEIEDGIGASLFDIGRKLERAEIPARDLLKFTHACLLHSGHKIEEAALSEAIMAQGAFAVIGPLVQFCQAYAFGGTKKKVEMEAAPGPSETAKTTSTLT